MDGEMIVELTSADIPGVLDAVIKSGIIISDLHHISELSVRFQVRRQDVSIIRSICEKRGDSFRLLQRKGSYWKLRRLKRHWLLLAGITALLMLTVWIPTRVFFIQVEGHLRIPARQILEEASRCGIYFGAERGTVRSERMKNALLEAIPELQWAAVNTQGCVAVITVKERNLQEDVNHRPTGDLVAIRDGIVLAVTAVRGTAAVMPGQAVRAGDLLISGYMDCGGVILRQGAEGEVYGRTFRNISAKTLEKIRVRGTEQGMLRKISLMIGKKRINFYEDSGILDTGCVKMYSEYCLSLPGGFVLPVKLRVETQMQYDLSEELSDPGVLNALLSNQVRSYLQTQMVAGSVISARASVDGCCYIGEFVCREMIGRMVYEESMTDYGQDR